VKEKLPKALRKMLVKCIPGCLILPFLLRLCQKLLKSSFAKLFSFVFSHNDDDDEI